MPPAPLARRSFLGRSCGSVASLAAAGPVAVPAGGFFVAGQDRLRIGLVGCGGRGTGAAAQAAAADPGVRITAVADLFADQIDSAIDVLRRTAGAALDCPEERRYVGQDAWRRLVDADLDADLDAVILATSPDARPTQAAAAVAAGRHVFCEAPAAVDTAGVATMLEACASAAARGLAFGSGLAWRHDPETARLIEGVRNGDIGRPLAAVVASTLGPSWHKATVPGAAGGAVRNWITTAALSGGDFVEHQVHAIDKALWAFGDATAVRAEPLGLGDHGGTAVRYLFADGRRIDARVVRRAGGPDRVEQFVRGTRGSCDLRCAGAGRHGRAMAAFVRAVRSGTPLAEGWTLCRATAAVILGREAARATA